MTNHRLQQAFDEALESVSSAPRGLAPLYGAERQSPAAVAARLREIAGFIESRALSLGSHDIDFKLTDGALVVNVYAVLRNNGA